MKCVKCQNKINQKRLEILPETKVCVECSTTEAVSCVDITYHKTGNTIQIMDKQSADKINKMAKRNGFGIMSGMKGSSGGDSKVTINKDKPVACTLRMPTEEDYQQALARLGEIIDITNDREKCLKFIDSKYNSRLINSKHMFNLKTIVNTLLPEEKKATIQEREAIVDEEIERAFRNWKNSKVYK